MDRFSHKTIEELKYYVYVLMDPRDKKIFYVGKGKGNRIFAHMIGAIENPVDKEKVNIIREILSEGFNVKHFILRHGIENETEAFNIESSVIDLLSFRDFIHLSKLSNLSAGHHAWDKGIVSAYDAELLFETKPLTSFDIKHNLLLININKTYKSERSLYDATRKHWKLNRNKLDSIDYVCGEYRGIIRGVFKPERWLFNETEKRWYFEGYEVIEEEILNLYLNKEYTGKKKGTQNPVRYLFK